METNKLETALRKILATTYEDQVIKIVHEALGTTFTKDLAGTDVLDLPMGDNDPGVATVRDYLKALVYRVWEEGEGFSGKRPFGNSGWEHELYRALIMAGYDPNDLTEMNHSIFLAIEAL